MRTVDYSDILRGSAALSGLQPANLTAEEFALFRTFHDRRLQLAWEIHRWPDLCRYERRSFRPPYDATHAYAAGDEVLDLLTLQYFQCLTAYVLRGNTSNPPTINGAENSAYWALCQTSYAADDYDSSKTYAIGDKVRNPSNGEVYQACFIAADLTVAGGPADGIYTVQTNTVRGNISPDFENGKLWYGINVPPDQVFYYIQWGTNQYSQNCWGLYSSTPNGPGLGYTTRLLTYSLSDTATPDLATNWIKSPAGKGGIPATYWPMVISYSRPMPGDGWAKLTPFNRYVANEQFLADGTALTAIGEFLFAWDKDPRVTTKLTPLNFTLSADGAQFTQLAHTPAYVWLLYRVRRPELTGDVWSATAVYASGQQAYFTDPATRRGNFYDCIATTTAGESPSSAPAKWSVVALPYIFRSYLIQAGHCDWLTSDGQTDKAGAYESLAISLLETEADKLQRQQGQAGRFQFKC